MEVRGFPKNEEGNDNHHPSSSEARQSVHREAMNTLLTSHLEGETFMNHSKQIHTGKWHHQPYSISFR